MGMTTGGLSYWQAETEGISPLEMTIGDLLDLRAKELLDQEAVVYSGYPEFDDALNLRWTYRDYQERANIVAKGLMALGLNKGDHIAVWAVNLPEWPLLMMGAAKAGLVLVTINPVLRAAEVEYILKQGDIRALFFMGKVRDHDCVATIRSMTTQGEQNGAVTGERLPVLRYVCLLGTPPAGLTEQAGWRPALFKEMLAGGASTSDEALRERQASVVPLDPATIMYTSGTTGFPKGAVLSHRGLLNADVLATQSMLIRIGLTGQGLHQLPALRENWARLKKTPEMERMDAIINGRFCVIVPFFHIFGSVGFILLSLIYGASIHPLLAFDPLKAMQIISQERCTFTGGVPTMLLAILQHPDFAKYDLSSLKWVECAGAPVPVALMEDAKARIGADALIPFGQTESSGVITVTQPDDSFELKSATVGIPVPYTDVKIINPATGEVVPVGERGEICCRGPLVLQGYYNMPEKTAETIDSEGWLHTGDLATMNAHGYVNIVGRLKDMVIRGGENIFPREIEEFLIRYPKVADVQVLGVPDSFFGEELLAVVIPKAGEQLTGEELREYCQGRLSHQKIPRYFQFVESYPLTASGKVQKFVLRELAITSLGLEEVAKIKTA